MVVARFSGAITASIARKYTGKDLIYKILATPLGAACAANKERLRNGNALAGSLGSNVTFTNTHQEGAEKPRQPKPSAAKTENIKHKCNKNIIKNQKKQNSKNKKTTTNSQHKTNQKNKNIKNKKQNAKNKKKQKNKIQTKT